MNARDAILQAVQAANAGRAPEPAEALAYRRHGGLDPVTLQARFLDRLADYDVHVTRVRNSDAIATAVETRLQAAGSRIVAAPAEIPSDWRPAGVDVLDAAALDDRTLDATPAALTGCAMAIAETGSIVIDGGAGQGRRALSLLPDHHLCVVFARQVVETVPQALQALAAGGSARRPLTMFSGPSATADIEFNRVVGVHGPRRLDVIFVAGA